jgi:hypothetical protein
MKLTWEMTREGWRASWRMHLRWDRRAELSQRNPLGSQELNVEKLTWSAYLKKYSLPALLGNQIP